MSKCSICREAVYPADPQINLDGRIFHNQCAKCADCKCQINPSNFSKSEVGGTVTLFCTTHYLKRFGEAGGSYLDGSKFAKKSERDALSESVLEKASQPEFRAIDGLVVADIPEGLSYGVFASNFSEAIQQTNATPMSTSTVQDFPEEAAPLEARRKSLQTTVTPTKPITSVDFPAEAVDIDSRRRSLNSAYEQAGQTMTAAAFDFPTDDTTPLATRRSIFIPASITASEQAGGENSSQKDDHISSGSITGIPHEGAGEYTSQRGSNYKGEWSSSLMHGNGILTLSNGSVYTGEFRHSKFHGQGSLVSCHGFSFDGEFCDSKMNGPGRMTYSDGRVVVGQWVNDVLATGVSVYPDL